MRVLTVFPFHMHLHQFCLYLSTWT